MSTKQLWKICSSNARARIACVGSAPDRIYPYCGIEYVNEENKEWQQYLNDFTRFTYEFHGGTWKK